MFKFRRRHYRRKHFFSFGIFVIFVIGSILGIVLVANEIQKSPHVVTQAKDTEFHSPIPSEFPTPTSLPSNKLLLSQIQELLQGTKGSYAIVVKGIHTNDAIFLNEHKKYPTGSLYKLWVMNTVYDLLDEQKLSLDEELSDDIKNLNSFFDISTDEAELTEGQITLTIGQALESMITISHNYAAFLLTKKISLSEITLNLRKNGFFESSISTEEQPPLTTAHDIASFYEKLYKGTLSSPIATENMIGLLKKQKINSKLPKYLPENVQVAHKTGEIRSYSHDAGIVYSPSGPYIIVVLTDTDDPMQAEEKIAEISKAVYDFFQAK